MSHYRLEGRRILVVEDEYLIADEMRGTLLDAGAQVLGPVPTIGEAMSVLAAEPGPDGALLDINLGGTTVFDLADALARHAVPIVFATGYDNAAIPDRFADVPRLEKPVKAHNLLAALGPLVASQAVRPT